MGEDWRRGMAFRYIGEKHSDELAGSVHYFVGYDPTTNVSNPIFVRKPNEGSAHLHWWGQKDDYQRWPEKDRADQAVSAEVVEKMAKALQTFWLNGFANFLPRNEWEQEFLDKVEYGQKVYAEVLRSYEELKVRG